jgi:Flp pilus assembly protein TadD
MLAELVLRQDWPAAFPVAKQLLSEEPDDAQVLAYRGTIYREQQMFKQAEVDLKRAIELDDELAYAHAALGVLYDLQRRAKEADEHHRRAVELEPERTTYLNNLGFSLYVRGETREAIEVLRRGLQSDPTDRRLQNNLGFAHAAAGDYNRAAKHFQLGGTPAEAANNLGFAYERSRNLAQAYELYAEALRLDPSVSRARRNLRHVARVLKRDLPDDLKGSAERASTGGPR